jgi:hypothetical protein
MKPLIVLFASVPLLAAQPPKFPEPYDSEKPKEPIVSAEAAAAGFKVPPGFRVEVFASEPDVRNPIACCWDTKGRFWVAENYTYAERQLKFDLNLRDRVLIFHDQAGRTQGLHRYRATIDERGSRPWRCLADLPAAASVRARRQRR